MLPRGDLMRPFMIITDSLIEIPPKIQTRNVVRAVAIKDKQILLMFSEQDKMYGTPGGGVILDEGLLDTLKRELQEETGAIKAKIISHIGNVEEFANRCRYLDRRFESSPITIKLKFWNSLRLIWKNMKKKWGLSPCG